METTRPRIGYLYLNGLGDGTTTFKDRVVRWWWRRAGLDIRHAHIDWYDGRAFEDKLRSVEKQVREMLRHYDRVVIVGSSAGASLAFHICYRLRDENIYAVSCHGRLRAGNYAKNDRRSLYRGAHQDTDKPSQSFFDSVTRLERDIFPRLEAKDKARLLILTQLTDLVVPRDCRLLPGIRSHCSLAFGHSGGFVVHFLADRDLLRRFATDKL